MYIKRKEEYVRTNNYGRQGNRSRVVQQSEKRNENYALNRTMFRKMEMDAEEDKLRMYITVMLPSNLYPSKNWIIQKKIESINGMEMKYSRREKGKTN